MTKEVFKAGWVFAMAVERVNVKMSMTAFCFNLHQMRAMKAKGVIEDCGSYPKCKQKNDDKDGN